MELSFQVRFKVYQTVLESLIQDEKIDFKYIFLCEELYLFVEKEEKKIEKKEKKKKEQSFIKQGAFFIVPTIYRLLLIDKTYKVFDINPPLLYNDIPTAFFEQERKPEAQRQQFMSTKTKKNNSKNQVDGLCLVFKGFWEHIVIEMGKDDLKKFQSYLLKLPPLPQQPLITLLKKDLLQSNQEISDSYKDIYITKKVKIIDEDQFWNRQPCFLEKSREIISEYQKVFAFNVDQVLNDLMSYCTLYKMSPLDEPKYKQKIGLINDLTTNMELESNIYYRNRPPKKNKQNKQEQKEIMKTQEELFINLHEQQQINKELGKQFIKTFGLRMIDELICKNIQHYQECQVQAQGQILNSSFLQQLELENDGIELKDPMNQLTIQHQDCLPLITKTYQTNIEWERDRTTILQQLNSFNQDYKFEKIEISQVIKENFRLALEVSQRSRQKIEDKEKEYFTDVRKQYSNIRRLLQYLFDGLKQKKPNIEMEEYTRLLQEEIKIIRGKIALLQNDTQKFKIIILEDLQKQIEKAINETIYQ